MTLRKSLKKLGKARATNEEREEERKEIRMENSLGGRWHYSDFYDVGRVAMKLYSLFQ